VQAVKNGEWSSWSPLWLCGTGVSNAVCGIVGLGRIGQKVAGTLRALGAREILYTGPREKVEDARTVNGKWESSFLKEH
jgi:glyoxylate/hydroxypyruvate reductase